LTAAPAADISDSSGGELKATMTTAFPSKADHMKKEIIRGREARDKFVHWRKYYNDNGC
jgi:hypothetical protein